ncbi:hypothetical protein [Edwardsiella anguillarum]|uniref:Uncharacterized protein n=1 Tax=Edwardsiella anguillarum ET080813 TaxID=667120 RepID=A0A076LUI8_9GAMM|nr:Hypothetical protein ETEE_3938 [Edwardsiella anguillarum ET080813]MDA6077661.1 hypothetical protein [Edwardsiella anguillarum]
MVHRPHAITMPHAITHIMTHAIAHAILHLRGGAIGRIRRANAQSQSRSKKECRHFTH